MALAFYNTVYAVVISEDGLVYTADRVNDRAQGFQQSGKFVQQRP